jgi:hypothetical protein
MSTKLSLQTCGRAALSDSGCCGPIAHPRAVNRTTANLDLDVSTQPRTCTLTIYGPMYAAVAAPRLPRSVTHHVRFKGAAGQHADAATGYWVCMHLTQRVRNKLYIPRWVLYGSASATVAGSHVDSLGVHCSRDHRMQPAHSQPLWAG